MEQWGLPQEVVRGRKRWEKRMVSYCNSQNCRKALAQGKGEKMGKWEKKSESYVH